MKALVLLVLMGNTVSAAELRIRVMDELERHIWTRLELRGPHGQMYQPRSGLRDATATNRPGGGPYYLGSFVVRGESSLELPVGRYTVVAEHGLEYERIDQTVEVREAAPAILTFHLHPWVRMHELGWWSGDMHIHRPPEDLSALAMAEDINISAVFTMWNKRNLWAGAALPTDPVRISPHHLVTLMNAEDERGGGAWMLNGLRKPLPLEVDGRWFPPGI